jgi:hypothetical protein
MSGRLPAAPPAVTAWLQFLSSLVDLFGLVNLEANPRLSKISRVTGDIEESMAKTQLVLVASEHRL